MIYICVLAGYDLWELRTQLFVLVQGELFIIASLGAQNEAKGCNKHTMIVKFKFKSITVW